MSTMKRSHIFPIKWFSNLLICTFVELLSKILFHAFRPFSRLYFKITVLSNNRFLCSDFFLLSNLCFSTFSSAFIINWCRQVQLCLEITNKQTNNDWILTSSTTTGNDWINHESIRRGCHYQFYFQSFTQKKTKLYYITFYLEDLMNLM